MYLDWDFGFFIIFYFCNTSICYIPYLLRRIKLAAFLVFVSSMKQEKAEFYTLSNVHYKSTWSNASVKFHSSNYTLNNLRAPEIVTIANINGLLYVSNTLFPSSNSK